MKYILEIILALIIIYVVFIHDWKAWKKSTSVMKTAFMSEEDEEFERELLIDPHGFHHDCGDR